MAKVKEGKEGRVVKRRIVTEDIETPEDEKIDEKELVEEKGFEETDDTRDFSGYDKTLRDYMETSGTVKDFTATLYVYDKVNKQKQYVVNSMQNELLSMNDVGMQFGSGDYRYLVTFPDSTKLPPKAFRFNIHPIYDEYRAKQGLIPVDPRHAVQAGNGKSSMLEAMEMMKMMVEMMKPLIVPPAPQTNPMDALMSSYRMTKDVLQNNLKENVGLYRELAKLQSEGDNMNAEVEEKEPDLLGVILPLLEKFAPIILGNGVKSQLAVQTIKAAPQFKEVIQNKSELKAVISGVEEKIGKQKTEEMLGKLKIKRPA